MDSSFPSPRKGTHRTSLRTFMLVRVLVLFLFVCCPVFAQEKVAVRLTNNTVLVPVRINHRDLTFILDTGSELSALDSSMAQQLGLTDIATIPVLKNYRERGSEMIEVPSLGIGSRVFAHKDLGTSDFRHVSAAIGVRVDGVLGNDILQSMPFQLNYSKREMTIGPFARGEGLGKAIQLRRDGDQFYVPLQIVSVPVELLLDTGTNSTNLSSETWQSVFRVWQPNVVIDGVVRAGSPTPPAFLVCLPSISLEDLTLTNQVMRVQRAVNSGAFSDAGFGGILGSDFLRQFEVTLDLARGRLFLKKDPRFRRDPYLYTTVGIQFAKDARNQYIVMAVWKNSPAEEAGLKVGDRIESVNGQPSKTLSLEQLRNQMHGPEGMAVQLVMERDSVPYAVTVRTRQMLCSPQSARTTLRAARK